MNWVVELMNTSFLSSFYKITFLLLLLFTVYYLITLPLVVFVWTTLPRYVSIVRFFLYLFLLIWYTTQNTHTDAAKHNRILYFILLLILNLKDLFSNSIHTNSPFFSWKLCYQLHICYFYFFYFVLSDNG